VRHVLVRPHDCAAPFRVHRHVLRRRSQLTTLPLLLYNAAMGGNYQVALILLVPSVLFMLFIERFLRADVLAKVGA